MSLWDALTALIAPAAYVAGLRLYLKLNPGLWRHDDR